jgi:hypothetical protein
MLNRDHRALARALFAQMSRGEFDSFERGLAAVITNLRTNLASTGSRPGARSAVVACRTINVDGLFSREGTSRNGWQPTADALLTIKRWSQPVATHGNGFGLSEPFPECCAALLAGVTSGLPPGVHRHASPSPLFMRRRCVVRVQL